MCKPEQCNSEFHDEDYESSEPGYREQKPFTVSAVFCDGSGKLIAHPIAADVQAARDQVLMQTGGAVIIVSIFAGHLVDLTMDTYFLSSPIAENKAASSSYV